MMGKKVDLEIWGWRVLPVAVVVGIGGVTDWLGKGWGGVSWLEYLMVLLGWVGGWLVADADRYFGKNKVVGEWMNEWRKATRNVLTAGVLGIVGLWMASSSASPLAQGLVFGMSVRLFVDYINAKEFKDWFWVFARRFSDREYRVFEVMWGLLLLVQWLLLVRG